MKNDGNFILAFSTVGEVVERAAMKHSAPFRVVSLPTSSTPSRQDSSSPSLTHVHTLTRSKQEMTGKKQARKIIKLLDRILKYFVICNIMLFIMQLWRDATHQQQCHGKASRWQLWRKNMHRKRPERQQHNTHTHVPPEPTTNTARGRIEFSRPLI